MENGMDYADPEHDSAGSAEHRLLQTEAEGHVHRILDQMPAHLSEVMRGVLGSEEGIHAVPASLGISTSVFRKRLLKARVILHRSMLAEQS